MQTSIQTQIKRRGQFLTHTQKRPSIPQATFSRRGGEVSIPVIIKKIGINKGAKTADDNTEQQTSYNLMCTVGSLKNCRGVDCIVDPDGSYMFIPIRLSQRSDCKKDGKDTKEKMVLPISSVTGKPITHVMLYQGMTLTVFATVQSLSAMMTTNLYRYCVNVRASIGSTMPHISPPDETNDGQLQIQPVPHFYGRVEKTLNELIEHDNNSKRTVTTQVMIEHPIQHGPLVYTLRDIGAIYNDTKNSANRIAICGFSFITKEIRDIYNDPTLPPNLKVMIEYMLPAICPYTITPPLGIKIPSISINVYDIMPFIDGSISNGDVKDSISHFKACDHTPITADTFSTSNAGESYVFCIAPEEIHDSRIQETKGDTVTLYVFESIDGLPQSTPTYVSAGSTNVKHKFSSTAKIGSIMVQKPSFTYCITCYTYAVEHIEEDGIPFVKLSEEPSFVAVNYGDVYSQFIGPSFLINDVGYWKQFAEHLLSRSIWWLSATVNKSYTDRICIENKSDIVYNYDKVNKFVVDLGPSLRDFIGIPITPLFAYRKLKGDTTLSLPPKKTMNCRISPVICLSETKSQFESAYNHDYDFFYVQKTPLTEEMHAILTPEIGDALFDKEWQYNQREYILSNGIVVPQNDIKRMYTSDFRLYLPDVLGYIYAVEKPDTSDTENVQMASRIIDVCEAVFSDMGGNYNQNGVPIPFDKSGIKDFICTHDLFIKNQKLLIAAKEQEQKQKDNVEQEQKDETEQKQKDEQKDETEQKQKDEAEQKQKDEQEQEQKQRDEQEQKQRDEQEQKRQDTMDNPFDGFIPSDDEESDDNEDYLEHQPPLKRQKL